MAVTNNLSDYLTAVANALRAKLGGTATINAQNFPAKIAEVYTKGVNDTKAIAPGQWSLGTTSGSSMSINSSTGAVTATISTSAAPASAGWIGTGGTGTLTKTSVSIGSVSIKSSSDKTVSGKNVSFPAGYYPAAHNADVDTMTAPTAASTTSSGTSKASVTLSTSSAQYINIPTGYNSSAIYYTIPKVTSAIDSNIAAGNIKSGVTILGVQGTYNNQKAEETGTAYPTASDQTLNPTSGKVFSSVSVKKVTTTNLAAGNIANGVTVKVGRADDDDAIASVTGTAVLASAYKYNTNSDLTITPTADGTNFATYFDAGSATNYSVVVTPKYTNTAGYKAATTTAVSGNPAYFKIKTTSGSKSGATVSWGTGWITEGSSTVTAGDLGLTANSLSRDGRTVSIPISSYTTSSTTNSITVPLGEGLTKATALSKSGGTISLAANSWCDTKLEASVTIGDLGYTSETSLSGTLSGTTYTVKTPQTKGAHTTQLTKAVTPATLGLTAKAAATYTPTTTDQTIGTGYYTTGVQTIKGDANLLAANIKKDVSIFGVTGTYNPTPAAATYLPSITTTTGGNYVPLYSTAGSVTTNTRIQSIDMAGTDLDTIELHSDGHIGELNISEGAFIDELYLTDDDAYISSLIVDSADGIDQLNVTANGVIDNIDNRGSVHIDSFSDGQVHATYENDSGVNMWLSQNGTTPEYQIIVGGYEVSPWDLALTDTPKTGWAAGSALTISKSKYIHFQAGCYLGPNRAVQIKPKYTQFSCSSAGRLVPDMAATGSMRTVTPGAGVTVGAYTIYPLGYYANITGAWVNGVSIKDSYQLIGYYTVRRQTSGTTTDIAIYAALQSSTNRLYIGCMSSTASLYLLTPSSGKYGNYSTIPCISLARDLVIASSSTLSNGTAYTFTNASVGNSTYNGAYIHFIGNGAVISSTNYTCVDTTSYDAITATKNMYQIAYLQLYATSTTATATLRMIPYALTIA